MVDPYDFTEEAVARGVVLVVLTGPCAGAARLVSGGVAVLGRGLHATLDLGDDAASRRHAVIEVRERVVTIEDTGSRNGTTINGRPIVGLVHLQDGDRIEIGGVVILVMFCCDGAVGARVLAEVVRWLLDRVTPDDRDQLCVPLIGRKLFA